MRRLLFLTLIACVRIDQVSAQCTVIDADVPDVVCRESSFSIENRTTAVSFEWDLCPFDLQTTPSIVNVMNTGLSSVLDLVVVEDDHQFYGFATDANSNSITRLNFGDSPNNIPTKVDLGNINGQFQFPNSLAILREDDAWVGIVANAGNNKVILLNFGSSLTNTPTATVLHTRGNGGFANIAVAATSADARALLIAEFNTRQITIVNYPQGFLMPADAAQTVSIPGSTPIDIQLVKDCDNWKALVLSFEDRQLYQLDFGSSFIDPPVVSKYGLTFGFEPYRLSIGREGENFYGFVSTTSGGLSRLNFEKDIDDDPTVDVFGGLGMLSNSRSLCVAAHEGEWMGFMINFSDGNLFKLSFQASCGVSPSFYKGDAPANIHYSESGLQKIVITAFDANCTASVAGYDVTVTDEVAPQFTIQHTNSCVDSDVAFQAEITGGEIIDFHWEFGDGNQSTAENPVHIYSASDSYVVSLEATGANSCINQQQVDLTIFDKPVSDFVLPEISPACTNQVLEFVNNSNYVDGAQPSWRWVVNSVDVSTGRDLTYTFDTPGPHTIALIAGIPGCESYLQQQLPALAEGPKAEFDYTGLCHGGNTDFQNTSIGDVESLLWDFGDGHTSNEVNPTNVFSDFGNYDVTLTLFGTNGCEVVEEKNVQIRSNPVLDFDASRPPSSCSGKETQFNNYSSNADGENITVWHWSFDDENDPATATEEEPRHTFKAPGVYRVSLLGRTDSGCESTMEKDIPILPSPSTGFTSGATCQDLPVTFTPASENETDSFYWEIGTSYYNTNSPTHTFKAPGSYRLYIEVTSINNCVASRMDTIEIPARLAPDFSVRGNCVDSEAVFTDLTTGDDTVVMIAWDFGAGEAFIGSPLNHVFTQPGSRNITMLVTAESGCVYQVTKAVQVVPPPVARFSASPPSGAYPLDVTFTNLATAATQFLWEFGDESAPSDEQSPVHTFLDPGTFEVRLTAINDQQCSNAFTGKVSTVAPVPDVDIEMISLLNNPDGTTKLIVTIHNKGNTLLTGLPLDIDFGGELEFREVIANAILPESKFNFVFNTSITNFHNLRYLCVTLNYENDRSPLGNKMCKEFQDSLLVFPVHPNPVSDNINLEWICGESKAVQISLLDRLGRRVFSAKTQAVTGLNSRILDVEGYESGFYFLLLENDKSRNIQRLLIFNRP